MIVTPINKETQHISNFSYTKLHYFYIKITLLVTAKIPITTILYLFFRNNNNNIVKKKP